jgi:hypothetical protein
MYTYSYNSIILQKSSRLGRTSYNNQLNHFNTPSILTSIQAEFLSEKGVHQI